MPSIQNSEPGWYCFKALPKREHIAALSLSRELELQCFCPRIKYEKKTKRGPVHFVECLFPGYVFVNTNLQETYRRILATRGIRDVVAFGDRVPRVPNSLIDTIKAQLDETDLKEIPAPVLSPGKEVSIIEGAFKDLNAVISGQLDSRQRIAVLLNFLGREMEVTLPASSLFVEIDNPRQKAVD